MADSQFMKNLKIYRNSNMMNQNALSRLVAFKREYYPNRKITLNNIENNIKNLASRTIQHKFKEQDWSNYLSLNRVPDTNDKIGYMTRMTKNFSSMSRKYEIITFAKLISAYVKWYGKSIPLSFKQVIIKINDLIKVAKDDKDVVDPKLTKIRLDKLEKLKEMMILKKQKIMAATKIQKSFRNYKSLPKTNENFIKYMWKGHSNQNIKRIQKFTLKKYGTNNIANAIQKVYKKRHESPTVKTAISTIQKSTRKYQKDRFRTIGTLIEDMYDDPEKRFVFQVNVLSKLYRNIPKVLNFITYYNKTPKNIITSEIGPCHIKPDEIPKKYLDKMYNQMIFVSQEYFKKSPNAKKKYLDELDSLIGGRPCIENLMDAMISALLEPVFEWTGKRIDPPLVNNNNRYLGQVMAKAISSWHQKLSNNNKAKLPNNLNKRKNIFWSMVKNMELHVRNKEGIPIYSRPAFYNVNGKKFKSSNLSNTLEYI